MTGASKPNPYPGPRPFLTGENLYGRDREVTKLFYLLSAERIVVLHSPSGAGKSSLLNAGLVPRLREERFDVWPTIRLSQPATDGGNRFVRSTGSSLEEGLPEKRRRHSEELAGMTLAEYVASRPRRPGAPASVVLVFDQFEEILTLDPLALDTRREFFRQLGEALENPEVWALFALREDYLGALDPYRDDVPTRLGNTFRVDLLTVDAAAEAIARPAKDAGREFAPDAALQLANDLAAVSVQQPDGSFREETGLYVEPLQLQVVCRRLWDGLPAETRTIGTENLLASGDVDAALAAYYDDSVADIAGANVATERGLREWFNDRLITPGGIRGQVLREQRASGGLDNDSVDRLVATHLVRSEQRDGKTWFELAHDRLVAPVRSSNAAWFEGHLHPMQRQATLWEREGKPDSLLLGGQELKDAESWARSSTSSIRPIERDLLDRSLEERKAHRRRRGLLGTVVAVLAGLVVAISLLALRASRAEDRANHAARVSSSSAFASFATNLADPDLTNQLALALEANRLSGTLEARGAMISALQGASGLEGVFGPSSSRVSTPTVAFSPDGKRLASGGDQVRVWNLARRQPVPQLDNAGEQSLVGGGVGFKTALALSVAFSPKRKRLAAVFNDGTLRLWDLSAGHPRETDLTSNANGSNVAFSPGGEMLANGGRLWNLASSPPRSTRLQGSGEGAVVAFSPVANTLATGSDDGSVRLWSSASYGSRLAGSGKVAVESIAFDPSGTMLATGDKDGNVRLWALSAQEQAAELLPENGSRPVQSLSFSSDGKTLASADDRGTVRLWSVPSRMALGTTASGYSVAFSPTSNLLATGGRTGRIRLWNLTFAKPFLENAGGDDPVTSFAFDQNGNTLSVGDKLGSVQLWDLASGRPLGPPFSTDRTAVKSFAFSSDGKIMATGNEDGTVRLWKLPSATPLLGTALTSGGSVSSLAFSPDGSMLAAGGGDGTARVWRVPSGTLIGEPVHGHVGFEGSVSPVSVAFSPDGETLAAGGAMCCPSSNFEGPISYAALWLWHPASPKTPATVTQRPGLALSDLAFGPEGRTLSALGGTSLLLWNLTKPGGSKGLAGGVGAAAFSSDGKTLAAVLKNGTVKLWDRVSGTLLGKGVIGIPAFGPAAFAPDGKTLATLGTDGALWLWRVPAWKDYPDLRDQVCRLAWGANLDKRQWRVVAPPNTAHRADCPR